MDIKKKILIDTDIGDDIDDAFALLSAMALNFEIIGITTVFRDTEARARMAKKLLMDFGNGYERVPVFAGYSTYAESKDPNYEHMCRFCEDLYDPAYTPDSTDACAAVDFIIESCHRYGKDLTVIAIGPFCNIAKVIEKDPEALGLVDKVAIMGGAFFRQYADWNVMCDVPAAELMFDNLSNLECIGADATHLLPADEHLMGVLRSKKNGAKALEYVKELYRQWQADYPANRLVLHDVLVIYYVLDPTICTMQRIGVKVICDGFAKGVTLNIDAYSKASLNSAYADFDFSQKILAAKEVDTAKFHAYVRRDIRQVCASCH